jgi:hypothetical protein
VAAPCSQWIACSPLRKRQRGRPLNWVVRHHPMASVDQIDKVLIATVTARWSKSAMVVARAMTQLSGVDDELLQQRLKSLAERGLIESAGNLSELRHSEVRLKQEAG